MFSSIVVPLDLETRSDRALADRRGACREVGDPTRAGDRVVTGAVGSSGYVRAGAAGPRNGRDVEHLGAAQRRPRGRDRGLPGRPARCSGGDGHPEPYRVRRAPAGQRHRGSAEAQRPSDAPGRAPRVRRRSSRRRRRWWPASTAARHRRRCSVRSSPGPLRSTGRHRGSWRSCPCPRRRPTSATWPSPATSTGWRPELKEMGVSAEWEVTRARHPADALIDFADRIADAVIVVASNRWTDADHTHLRSVARRLAHEAHHPVLVVRGREAAEPGGLTRSSDPSRTTPAPPTSAVGERDHATSR